MCVCLDSSNFYARKERCPTTWPGRSRFGLDDEAKRLETVARRGKLRGDEAQSNKIMFFFCVSMLLREKCVLLLNYYYVWTVLCSFQKVNLGNHRADC